jgi:hypothetical protein
MLINSVNNQTIFRSKTKNLKWLGRRFLNITFSIQEDDPIVDIEEIREVLGENCANSSLS